MFRAFIFVDRCIPNKHEKLFAFIKKVRMDKVKDAVLLNETKEEKQRFQVGHTLPTCPQTHCRNTGSTAPEEDPIPSHRVEPHTNARVAIGRLNL